MGLQLSHLVDEMKVGSNYVTGLRKRVFTPVSNGESGRLVKVRASDTHG
jgi:hypothetical protein